MLNAARSATVVLASKIAKNQENISFTLYIHLLNNDFVLIKQK